MKNFHLTTCVQNEKGKCRFPLSPLTTLLYEVLKSMVFKQNKSLKMAAVAAILDNSAQNTREKILQDYRKKLLSHKDVESRLKEGMREIFTFYFGP